MVPCTGALCSSQKSGSPFPSALSHSECELQLQGDALWSHGRMLWEPEVACWSAHHTVLSAVCVLGAMVWTCSITLVPLQLYYVRNELQVRQQHWWRMVLTLLKCGFAALLATALAGRNGLHTWRRFRQGEPSRCVVYPQVALPAAADGGNATNLNSAPVAEDPLDTGSFAYSEGDGLTVLKVSSAEYCHEGALAACALACGFAVSAVMLIVCEFMLTCANELAGASFRWWRVDATAADDSGRVSRRQRPGGLRFRHKDAVFVRGSYRDDVGARPGCRLRCE